MCLVNFLIVLACLIRLLVYGEPIVDMKKCDTSHRLKQIAEQQFGSGDMQAAAVSYQRYLRLFGVCLPSANTITWIECITFTTWQISRAIFHRIPFGLWLSRKVGGLFCSPKIRTQAICAYKEIAWILHRLNQIDLIEIRNGAVHSEHNNRRSIYGLMVALYATNMSEIAETAFQTKEMVEVYLTTALRMKSTGKLSFLSGYFLRQAKHFHLLNTTQNKQFDWVFTERGYRFVSTMNVNTNSAETPTMCDPISFIQNEYCHFLLSNALNALLGLNKDTTTASSNRRGANVGAYQLTDSARVLEYVKLLQDCLDDETNSVSDLIAWLTRIVAAAAHWRQSELENSEPLYIHTDRFPRSLVGTKNSEKTLYKALFVSFVARRELVHRHHSDAMNKECLQLIRNRCNVASVLLHDHVTCSRSQNEMPNSLAHLIRILTCDWLLETRTECWEWSIDAIDRDGDEGISEPNWNILIELKSFHQDLNSMQMIVDVRPMGQSRVNMYEAIYRLMACATPLETHRLLERNILQTRHSRSNLLCVGKGNGDDEFVCGERDRALSIYFACRFLPAQVSVERNGLLTRAAAIFKQIGDIDNMNRCFRLLNQSNYIEMSDETNAKNK